MSFPHSIIPEGSPPIENDRKYLASMGIYIFNADTMEKLLDNNYTDFGKEIIPLAIGERHVNTYVFTDFWEDIGTIKAFYDTNLNMASLTPAFNFYDELMPIYTHRRHLPATKINFSTMSQSLTGEGSIITNASIVNSVVGVRTLIESGASLDGVYCMGATYYETQEEKKRNEAQGIPNLGIGRGTIVKRAIIDHNVRIGDGCRIGIDNIERKDGDYGNYWIVDGIIVIPKNGIIPPGTNI
jgi:glucose-1-phosphate adenylyltransferase